MLRDIEMLSQLPQSSILLKNKMDIWRKLEQIIQITYLLRIFAKLIGKESVRLREQHLLIT